MPGGHRQAVGGEIDHVRNRADARRTIFETDVGLALTARAETGDRSGGGGAGADGGTDTPKAA